MGSISTPGLTDSTRCGTYIQPMLRRATRDLTRWDVLLPAGVAVLGVVELALLQVDGWAVGALLEVLACTLLVWRRLHALVFATLAELVLLVIPYVGPALDEPAVPIMILAIAVYALGRWIEDLRGLLGVSVVLLM